MTEAQAAKPGACRNRPALMRMGRGVSSEPVGTDADGSPSRRVVKSLRHPLRTLERVVDLLEEVDGLLLIRRPGLVEVLQRVQGHPFRLGLSLIVQFLD